MKRNSTLRIGAALRILALAACALWPAAVAAQNSPAFVNSTPQWMNVCINDSAVSINSLLAAADADNGQNMVWVVFIPPAHGVLSGFPDTAISNGGIVTPTGLTYTPAVNYSGPDAFVIWVHDGFNIAAMMINVTVGGSLPRVSDYTISGIDPTLTFSPSGDSLATSFRWSFGDGSTATTRTATHTYATPGIYPVKLRVSNVCGADSVQKNVGVMIISTGIADVAISDVKLFPNPATNLAIIEATDGLELRGVQVMSATGAIAMTVPTKGNRITINTAGLARGVYTLRIQLDKGAIIRKLEVMN